MVNGLRLCEFALVLDESNSGIQVSVFRGDQYVCSLAEESPDKSSATHLSEVVEESQTAMQGSPLETAEGSSSNSLLLMASGEQLAVFDSQDLSGTVPDLPTYLGNGAANSQLHLFIYIPGGTTSAGTLCVDADGDELCGYDLLFEATGGVEIVSFVPNGSVVHSATSARLRLNDVDASNGLLGTIHIGDLEVSTDGVTAGSLRLRESSAVDAALGRLTLAERPIALVPEPSRALMLVAGLATLLVFARRKGADR